MRSTNDLQDVLQLDHSLTQQLTWEWVISPNMNIIESLLTRPRR
jgi:hypothetical protein